MTNKKILVIALSVVIGHFIFTSVIGHCIAVQVGSQIGRIVAEGLIEAGEKKTDNTYEEAKRIDQNMKWGREKRGRCQFKQLKIVFARESGRFCLLS